MAASGECDRLRIGVHGLIAGSFLDNLLASYRKEHPCIAVEMIEATAREAVMQLRADRIEVAFVIGAFDLTTRQRMPADDGARGSLRRPALAGVRSQSLAGMRAITLISKSKPASQLTPIAVQFG